jgi:methylglutaconyl-CoA hydratase
VAVKSATFAFSEVKLGLIPATIAPYVVEAVGARRARALFLTGNPFDADYAAHVGLVDAVVPDVDALHGFIDQITGTLTACAPGAMGEAKRVVHLVANRRIDSGLMDDTARLIARARVSAEGQEGVRAFLDKRKPNWAK